MRLGDIESQMGVIASAVRELIALGVQGDALVSAIERIENGAMDTARQADEAAERRRAYDRERKRQKRNSTGNPRNSADTECPQMSTGIPRNSTGQERTPLARVLDNLLDSTPLDGTGVVVSLADGWPLGDAQDHVRHLVAIANSPNLDPHKSDGLITTAARLAAWRAAGASWANDVLPVVTTQARRMTEPIATWKFFDRAIAKSIANNRQALEIPNAQRPYANQRQSAAEQKLRDIDAAMVAAVEQHASRNGSG